MRYERRAFADSVIQDRANRPMQSRDLRGCERIRGSLRVQSGAPQRLVSVDIADPANHRLVHDGRFQRDAATLKFGGQIGGGELACQRLDADALPLDEWLDFGLWQQMEPRKLTDICEVQD